MSYDFMLFRENPGRSTEDLSDENVLDLGTVPEVRDLCNSILPDSSWAETAGQTWGSVVYRGHRLEIILGDASSKQIKTIMIKASLREPSTEIVLELARKLSVAVFDMQTGRLVYQPSGDVDNEG